MSTPPRTPTRTDRLVALHEQLTAAVDDLAHSDAWKRMLTIAARMPNYSPSNVILISVQLPEATRVAGYRAWNQLGRHVRHGEKGIAILAPCLYRPDTTAPVEASTDPGGDAAQVLRGFRVVHVFDISQTDGPPLPPDPRLLTGAEPEHLWTDLALLAHHDGFTLERGDCYGANGYTRFDDRTIRVRQDVDPAQAVKTLAHEVGHVRADHETRFAGTYHQSVTCRGIAEIEAESIAHLVVTAAGLDTRDYSVPYLAGWSGGDASVLRDTATRVIRTASRIDEDLAQLSRHDNPRLDGLAASFAADATAPRPAVDARDRAPAPHR